MIKKDKTLEDYRTPEVESMSLDSLSSLCEGSPVAGQETPFTDDEF